MKAHDRTTDITNLGGVQVVRPSPTESGDHQRPGIGDAEFFPRCIAAGCSPTTKTHINNSNLLYKKNKM